MDEIGRSPTKIDGVSTITKLPS